MKWPTRAESRSGRFRKVLVRGAKMPGWASSWASPRQCCPRSAQLPWAQCDGIHIQRTFKSHSLFAFESHISILLVCVCDNGNTDKINMELKCSSVGWAGIFVVRRRASFLHQQGGLTATLEKQLTEELCRGRGSGKRGGSSCRSGCALCCRHCPGKLTRLCFVF